MTKYYIIALHAKDSSMYWAGKPQLVLMDEASRYESREKAEEALDLVPIFTYKDAKGKEQEMLPEILEVQGP